MENIIVTGVRVNPIDVSSVESVTVLSADQLVKDPGVARSDFGGAAGSWRCAVATSRSADGKLPSFGGSSVAENQYYVNGFNVTNSFRGLNFSKIPFEAIAEQQVKTGGYGAEFGRSLGGVVSQTTKRGTNEFQSGSSIYWTPGSLRARPAMPTIPTRSSRAASARCVPSTPKRRPGEWTANVWASGALVEGQAVRLRLDRLPASTKKTAGAMLTRPTTPTTGPRRRAGW